jgi:hypothetical protein
MVICTIISFSVVGYLALVTQQSSMSARSQVWNMAIAISEAGVEEGLQHLNSNPNQLGTSGWTADGSTFSMTRVFANGNSYTVEIDNSAPATPIITSRATISVATVARNTPQFFVAATGVDLSSGAVSRAVRVRTSRSNQVPYPLAAKEGIDLKGNGVLTDSFDSGDPARSTNGHYDPAKVGDKGDVACNAGIVNVVSVQNANIYGHVRTGKGGTASIGSQGAVGSHEWQNANGKGIQPGWATEDSNFTFPDTTAPYSSGIGPEYDKVVSTPIGVVTNTTYINGSVNYPITVPAGSTMSSVVTNISTLSSSVYPGAIAGLTTNASYTTVSTYPGVIPGLVTNNAGFTTVTSYPGPKPGLTTNYNASGKKITGYTYASSFNYTYPSLVYSYPALTYSYNLHQTTTIYSTNHYDVVLKSGDYYATELTGKVYVNGKARIVLPNGLSMSGNDQIVLGPLGSLAMYAGGTSFTIGGNGVLNPSGFAGNFIVYCAPSVTDLTLNGNGEFTGVLIAPNAAVKLNGGGNSDEDFIGALMAKTIRLNGHFKFHYDEALSRMEANGRFLITSWDEVRN